MKKFAAIPAAFLIILTLASAQARQNDILQARAYTAPPAQGDTKALPANITVTGRGYLIQSGGISPGTINGTRQVLATGSSPKIETYKIQNTGGTNLVLIGSSPVSIVGSSDISVHSQPTSMTLQPTQETTFSLRFNPVQAGITSATVRISNSDPETPIFSFAVEEVVVTPGAPIEYRFDGEIPIPDNNPAGLSIPFTVSGLNAPIANVSVRINGSNCSVSTGTGLQHTWMSDLQMKVTGPDATSVSLLDRRGGNGDNLCQVLFDDSGTSSVSSMVTAGAPFRGVYHPEQALSAFVGLNPNGDWILNVADVVGLDTGTVRSVSLILRLDVSLTAARDWELFE